VQIDLEKEEIEIFEETLATGNYDLFTEYYFQLPKSGTWITNEDNVEQFNLTLEIWEKIGRPLGEFQVEISGEPITLLCVRDPYYDPLPIFLLPHGFRTLPWMMEFLSPKIARATATTGTGSGKTAQVTVRALACCALYPGFRYLNVAPTQYQADLALGELAKWAGGTRFEKFIRKPRGARNELWAGRPPTCEIVSPLDPGLMIGDGKPMAPSLFICQTVSRDARAIMGGERDWINVDEAQLCYNIGGAEHVFGTRLRGTRATGDLRWSKLTWISNPGRNPEWVALQESYQELVEKGNKNILVLQDVPSDVNIYLTKHQLELQRLTMSSREADRWLGGQQSAVYDDNSFPEEWIESCHSLKMDEVMQDIAVFDDELGVVGYELPFDKTREYMVVGDYGKGHLATMGSRNVPCVMVFDITNFLEEPCTLAAFYWINGGNSYIPFVDKFKYLVRKYRARGYYDATNIQNVLEEIGGFDKLPFTEPVYFSGTVHVKKWAMAVCQVMMQNRMFKWPYIKGLWYQARIYDVSSQKLPDDIMATLLVFGHVLGREGTLWSRFSEYFKWEEKTDDSKGDEDLDEFLDDWEPLPSYDRHARI